MKAARTPQATQGGFTLIETLIAMTLFSIGVLTLAQVQFAATRSSTSSKRTSTASALASDRLEEIVFGPSFAAITDANFPDEDYGDVSHSDDRYKNFKRTVAVADSVNIAGTICMKSVTVTVAWEASNGERTVELQSRVARF